MTRWIAVLSFVCLTGMIPDAHARTWVRGLFGAGVEEFRDVAETPTDSGAVYAGYTTSFGAGGRDVWVVKYDACGTVDWERTFGGQADDQAEAVLATADGGFLVLASTRSFGSGGSDLWLLKLDSGGNLENEIVYGNEFDETAADAIEIPDGYIVVGNAADQNGVHDAVVLRLEADLSVVWSRRYGGNGDDRASAITSTDVLFTLEDLLIAGFTDSFGVGDGDFWVLRISPSGDVIDERTYHGLGVDVAHDLRVYRPLPTDPVGFLVVGETTSATLGKEMWLLRLASDLTVVWSRTYGGTGNQIARSVSASIFSSDFVVGGETDSFGGGGVDLWLLRIDSAGSPTFQKTYGGTGDERANAVVFVPFDEDVFAAGTQDTRAWALRLNPGIAIDGACSIAADSFISEDDLTPTIGFPQAFTIDFIPGAIVSLVTPQPSLSTANLVCTGRPPEVSAGNRMATAGSRRFIEPLEFTGPSSATWEPAAFNCSDYFNIYRGDLFNLADFKFGICLLTQLQQNSAELEDVPFPGSGYFYLVSGVNDFGEGVLGFTSSGEERVPELVCP